MGGGDSKENQRNQQPFDPDYRGKHFQLTFTVEDPNVFTTPWSATVTYRRLAGEWQENACAENPNKYGTERDAQVPTANKPDCGVQNALRALGGASPAEKLALRKDTEV